MYNIQLSGRTVCSKNTKDVKRG